MTRARSTAMRMASAYSRKSDFRRTGAATSTGAGASGRVSVRFMGCSALEDGQEGLLRHFHLADLLHALLTLLLLLEELALARDVPAVALGGHVFAHGLDGFPGDDPAPHRGLDGHLVELARDDPAELLGQRLALLVGLVAMNDDGQRVHRIAVEEDVELDHVGLAELQEVVVEGGVALGDGLQSVVEVDHDLGEGKVELDVAALAHVLERLVLTALLLGELVDLAHELRGHEDGAAHVGLLDALDLVGGRQLRGILHLGGFPLRAHHPEAHGGRGDDEGEIELALQPLLHDFQVEHAQKAAAEAVAEGERGLGLVVEGRVVEAELFQGVAQALVVRVLDGIEAGEDHGLGVAVARAGRRGGAEHVGDRLAHLGVGHPLDGSGEETDLARAELLHLAHVGGEDTDLLHLVGLAVGHEEDALSRPYSAVDEADVDHHALIGVIEGVEDKGLQRRAGIAGRRRDPRHDGLEHLRHARAVLGGDGEGLVAVQAEDVRDLGPGALDIGGGLVDLVDHGHDLESAVEGEVEVGEGLRLHPLSRVHDEHGALAGRERTRDLVGEVHVAGGVDQVERVLAPVARRVEEAHGVGLDGDAALLLQVHRVQHLAHRLLGVHGPREGEEAVRQGGLAVVDVGDDGEIADTLDGHLAQDITRSGAMCRRERRQLTTAPSSRTVPGAIRARGPTRTPAPRMQSCNTAPGPTVTFSQSTAPSTDAPAPTTQWGPSTVEGPTRASLSTRQPSPTTTGDCVVARVSTTASAATARPAPPTALAGPTCACTRPASRSRWAWRYLAGLPMSIQ